MCMFVTIDAIVLMDKATAPPSTEKIRHVSHDPCAQF